MKHGARLVSEIRALTAIGPTATEVRIEERFNASLLNRVLPLAWLGFIKLAQPLPWDSIFAVVGVTLPQQFFSLSELHWACCGNAQWQVERNLLAVRRIMLQAWWGARKVMLCCLAGSAFSMAAWFFFARQFFWWLYFSGWWFGPGRCFPTSAGLQFCSHHCRPHGWGWCWVVFCAGIYGRRFFNN